MAFEHGVLVTSCITVAEHSALHTAVYYGCSGTFIGGCALALWATWEVPYPSAQSPLARGDRRENL